MLPPYPVRVACEALAEDGLSGRALLAGLAHASSVFYNYSGQLECLDYNKVRRPDHGLLDPCPFHCLYILR